MYFLGLFGLMLVTLGVCGLVLPFIPSQAGGNSGTSPSLVIGSIGAIAAGVAIFRYARARRAD
jgi:hypothetical protein